PPAILSGWRIAMSTTTLQKPIKPFSMLSGSLTGPPPPKAVRESPASAVKPAVEKSPKPAKAVAPSKPAAPPEQPSRAAVAPQPIIPSPPAPHAPVPYVETEQRIIARIAALPLARERLPEIFNDTFPYVPVRAINRQLRE